MTFLTGEEPEDSDFDLPKLYEPIESFESLKDRLNMFLFHYNESIRGTGMDMVFFQDAMIHLVKVLWSYSSVTKETTGFEILFKSGVYLSVILGERSLLLAYQAVHQWRKNIFTQTYTIQQTESSVLLVKLFSFQVLRYI